MPCIKLHVLRLLHLQSRHLALMSLPERTTVLIIGAGPTGLSTAISLVHHGFREFIIAEEKSTRGEASRAMTIHASTLEVFYCAAACPRAIHSQTS